jgi:hypothetical protein
LGWCTTVFEVGFVVIRLPSDCASRYPSRLRVLFNPYEGWHAQSIGNKTGGRAESDVGYRPRRHPEEASAQASNKNPRRYKRRRGKGFCIARQIQARKATHAHNLKEITNNNR